MAGFFDSFTGIIRVIVVSILAYVALIVLLRFSGDRTLANMNVFDVIVTIPLTDNVALAESIAAFVVLIGLQYVVTRDLVIVAVVAHE